MLHQLYTATPSHMEPEIMRPLCHRHPDPAASKATPCHTAVSGPLHPTEPGQCGLEGVMVPRELQLQLPVVAQRERALHQRPQAAAGALPLRHTAARRPRGAAAGALPLLLQGAARSVRRRPAIVWTWLLWPHGPRPVLRATCRIAAIAQDRSVVGTAQAVCTAIPKLQCRKPRQHDFGKP